MRKFLRILFHKPVIWAANKFSSRPDRNLIFAALTKLAKAIWSEPGKRGLVIPFDQLTGKFIIFSDQHKGRRNGADDFVLAEPNFLAAMNHYFLNGYTFINLGDSEELWENTLMQLKGKNQAVFGSEKKFLQAGRFIKIFGNHDLYWDNDPLASWQLERIYGQKVKVYEGVILVVNVTGRDFQIFCTHGHQGDKQSDGNWFSKFFVARIWGPIQSYLGTNPNTPAYNSEKKTLHNNFMYEWSSEQKDMLLITGHTHQPVFASLTLLERLYKEYQLAQLENDEIKVQELLEKIRKREKEFSAVSIDYMSMKPTYFNSGCCCFNDGDITGIEITDGSIQLIKWTSENGLPERRLLEEFTLEKLAEKL